MGFRQGSYATVWEVRKGDNHADLRISISKKNKETGEYVDEFGGFVRCYGKDCVAKALTLNPRDRIKLGDVDVTQRYDKEKKITYTNFKMFGFDIEAVGGSGRVSNATVSKEPEFVVIEEDDSDLPF